MLTLGIIQARYKSSRLQGKVLLDLHGRTVLSHVIRRLQRCKNIDAVVVATSTEPEDTLIIQEAIKNGAQYFTGSHEDVLNRYYQCAKLFHADRIVRITADCPFVMPDLIDKLIKESHEVDYGSNVINRTYPKGLDCEYMTFSELERANQYCMNPLEREHVTAYIRGAAMQKYSLEDSEDYSHKRITLDTIEDYRDLKTYPIQDIYTYEECKPLLSRCISTEESSIALDLGRV
jgi:spore coat polysaccharide biosynthesis protein SpsF (cytidylyltransferase family)